MTDWPFGRDELEPYYREVLKTLPLSGEPDGLSEEFPSFSDQRGHVTAPPQAEVLLDRLSKDARLRARKDVAFGRARLAVRSRPDDPRSCRYCGQCSSGCAYGAIANADDELELLRRNRAITYLGGRVVRTVRETDGGALVHCDLLKGGRETIEASHVFLAAGAINSTRIIMESLEMWEKPVRLLTTQSFVVPLIQPLAPPAWPTVNTLAAVFFEFKIKDLDHWIHVQINPPNEIVQARLGYRRGGVRLRDRVLAPVVDRSLVALVNLHSDHAGHHRLTLKRGRAQQPGVLRIEPVVNPAFNGLARRASARLLAHLARSGVIGAPPILGSADGPSGWHVGGSVPMGASRPGQFGTDMLGRPAGYGRLHVVDSSVFPSVPATTVALLAMANSTRIVDRAMALVSP